MYSVGLDVDNFVSTIKILLYAGNSCENSPLILKMFGKIYFLIPVWQLDLKDRIKEPRQSARNFCYSTKAKAGTDDSKIPAGPALARIWTHFYDLPKISPHVSQNIHDKFLKDRNHFGFFLAGLIEANGNFDNRGLTIDFHESDVKLVYYIKKFIGYGNVYKLKDNAAFRYNCVNKAGMLVIINLVNGKFVSHLKYDQIIHHGLLNKIGYTGDFLAPLYTISLKNYWLAGFTQANSLRRCFFVSIVKSTSHKYGFNVVLEFSLTAQPQNDKIILTLLFDQIKRGNISQSKSGIWCYKLSGYLNAFLIINYFDEFNVFDGKYINYLKFRKTYIFITEGRHLDKKGLDKIRSINSKGSSETSTQKD